MSRVFFTWNQKIFNVFSTQEVKNKRSCDMSSRGAGKDSYSHIVNFYFLGCRFIRIINFYSYV